MKTALSAEFIGTYFLTLTIGLAIANTSVPPLVIGVGLTILVYAGGHLSGAHYNPAVTVALYLRGAFERTRILPYFGSQFAGALLAAGSVAILKNHDFATMDIEVGPAFLAELLFTFLLIWVIFNVATLKSTAGNNYFGFAIGGTVMTGAFTVGSISGAVFNPAVGAGLLALGILPFGSAWIFLLANFGAAFLTAALARQILEPVEPGS